MGSNKTHVCVRWGQTKHMYVYGGVKQNTRMCTVGSNKTLWHLYLLFLRRKHYWVRTKNGWLRDKMICLSKATCLPMKCCFCDIAVFKPNLEYTYWSSTSHHYHHDIIELIHMIVPVPRQDRDSQCHVSWPFLACVKMGCNVWFVDDIGGIVDHPFYNISTR